MKRGYDLAVGLDGFGWISIFFVRLVIIWEHLFWLDQSIGNGQLGSLFLSLVGYIYILG
ncbi:hypothetical protein QBC43DRAFT_313452 [Cladorrhinum sp. PSN259]|nr:hypothetical protein QBC43DRAFT_313452 [Cladorrhinum sp. PSN259]